MMFCPSADERLNQQLRFLLEIDRLKGVDRQSYVLGGARKENSAEHSWHVAVMALILSEHGDPHLDRGRVVAMLLVHDLVEIDAGDTYIYDERGQLDKAAREQAAASRLFGLLPPDQGRALRALWDEYEAGETPEAALAGSLDRLMPLLHNVATAGRSWREHGVRPEQVRERNLAALARGCPRLAAYAESALQVAEAAGFLAPHPPSPP